MILKALEMQGFKSFPDKTVLEFNKGITAVVGPNGSGKSNISDAVRWVLGEQSTKTLRGSKMEDVIFSGTDVRKAKGFAEVTLRLDNTDRSLNKDSDEVSVTRRYYRSGDSEYLVNGESARLRDVNELFMDTGLGRDGYSIVGQGKIADMVSPKASERRDMLEEAAGISHFRYRRGDAIKRLAQAEENLVRLRDILSELENRVGPLKAQSEKAQKFIVLAGERKNLEIGIWLNTIDKTGEKMRDQEHKIEIAEASHKEAQDELSKIGEMIDKAADGTRDINIKLEEIRNSASGFEEKLSDIDSQIKVAENSILHNNETIERWTYTNGTIADTVWNTTDVVSKGYQEAGNWVGVLFFWQAIGSVVWAMILPKISNEKFAYALSLVIGAVGFAMVPFVTDKYLLVLPFLLIGCAWAAMLAMPFAFVTNALEGYGHKGAYLGLFNGTICIPQIIAAALGGIILSMVGSHQYNMMIVAAVSLVLGAACVGLIKKK